MRATNAARSRAVRTFMAREPVTGRTPSSWAGNFASEHDSSSDASRKCSDRARSVASAVLRARQARHHQGPSTVLPEATAHDHSGRPAAAPSVLSSSSSAFPSPQDAGPHAAAAVAASLGLPPRALTLWDTASSFAKSAYTVHLAHQHRYDTYPTHDLSNKVEQDWAAWGIEEKQEWMLATPQGRKALHMLRAELALAAERKLESSASTTPGLGDSRMEEEDVPRPHLSKWLNKYDRRLVVKRKQAKDVTVPQLLATEAPRAFVGPALLPFAEPQEPPKAYETAQAVLGQASKELEGTVQRALWHQELSSLFGHGGSEVFTTSVKHDQRVSDGDGVNHSESGATTTESPHSEEGPLKEAHSASVPLGATAGRRRAAPRVSVFWTASASPAATSDGHDSRQRDLRQKPQDAVYSDTFLAFCTDLGVNSPRRVYIMQKLLPHLDSKAGGHQKTLAEVEALATKFSAEYDANVAELQEAGKEEALAAYEKELLKEELDRLQAKMSHFQSQLPLLMRWMNVLRHK